MGVPAAAGALHEYNWRWMRKPVSGYAPGGRCGCRPSIRFGCATYLDGEQPQPDRLRKLTAASGQAPTVQVVAALMPADAESSGCSMPCWKSDDDR